MPRVTPAGVRAGLAEALAGLVELRGGAVCAYAGAVAEHESAEAAAAEAFAAFRAHVVAATDLQGLDPDAILLKAVRESSAARAPRPARSGSGLRRLARRGGTACDLVPRLLAARANRGLSHEDAVRLDRHMAGCPGCRELRERFRTAENRYVEAADTQPAERNARALLLALAGAAPLADGTPHSITEEALALLRADVDRPEPARSPEPPPEEVAATGAPPSGGPPAEAAAAADPPDQALPPSPTDTPDEPAPQAQPADVPPPRQRAPDPWPSDPAAAGPRPAPAKAPAPDDGEAIQADGAGAGTDATATTQGARVGTAPGRVSFGRRTVVIRSGIMRSGPETSSSAPEPDRPGVEQEPAAPAPDRPAIEPEPADPAPSARPVPGAREQAPEEGDDLALAPWPSPAPAPAPAGGPGAPPDSGTLARVVPGVLIVMAIGIALLVAGIVGTGGTPATTNDVEPPSLREPPREPTGALPPPSAPGAETSTDAN